MSERWEYRVVWQRVGRKRQRRILQTQQGAIRHVAALRWSDQAKLEEYDEGPAPGRYADMPDIEWIIMQRRKVDAWPDVAPHSHERSEQP
jgi:hypothetical protein